MHEFGALDFGERCGRIAEEHGYGGVKVRNSLIAMYSRCGCVDKAYCGVTWDSSEECGHMERNDLGVGKANGFVGEWSKVSEVGKLMREKEYKLLQRLHRLWSIMVRFMSLLRDDDAHPRKVEIYEKLNEINKRLRILWLCSKCVIELHDLDYEGRKVPSPITCEKLAIAFALLVTP
ncbi:unnamed protein product [Miscanthus lutarioriparius]|uniref:Uncharacterized protein n=1 Tax=Miscanthus lutarioriparius TaxID=422564 RepID=A0A811Q4I5_9POAL|nr:unnamed protein product [Miscanthus lutarioriparius]